MTAILVVIPARHAESTLEPCVNAVFQSTIRQKLRVVVVDDGGNPHISRHLAGYPVTVVSTGEARSAAYARDVGVSQGDSEVVVFLDADVIVEPDAIETLVQPILRQQADAVVGNYSRQLQGLNFAQAYKQLYISHVYSRRHGSIANEFWTALGAVKTSVYREVGGFNTAFRGATGEDVDFGIRLTRAHYRILQEPGALAQHRHPFSVVTLLNNDLAKGLNLSRNFLLGSTRLAGNRHSSVRDILAVSSASVFAAAFVTSLLGSFSLRSIWLLTIPLFFIYLAARTDLLRTFSQPGFRFLSRSVPMMYVLDLVRGGAVALSVIVVWLNRQSRVKTSPLAGSPSMGLTASTGAERGGARHDR
jgi:cellulose synthase/poly-beta-1,6-N-acetylglucosamine synthase-like glycosyltransferase